MPYIAFITLLLTLVGSLFGASSSRELPRREIIGGNAANIRDYPFIVYIDFEDGFCSGTIANQNWVITAAHCVVANVPGYGAVTVKPQYIEHGGYDSGFPQVQFRRIGRVIPHPDYYFEGAGFRNDVALVEVLDPLPTYAKPIELSSANREARLIASGTTVRMVGYGLMEGNNWPSTAIRDLVSQVLLPSDCRTQRLFDNPLEVGHDATLCAGSSSAGIYGGDSGGPLLVRDHATNVWVQIGVASMTAERGGSTVASIYHRVSTTWEWAARIVGLGHEVVPGPGNPSAGDPIVRELRQLTERIQMLSREIITLTLRQQNLLHSLGTDD